jgi:hypothetical protein
LENPFVLIGFGLFLLFGLYTALVKSRVLPAVSKAQSPNIIRLILNHGFVLSMIVIVLGVGYAAFHAYLQRGPRPIQGPITQQTGACGTNIVGDNNKSDVNCGDNTPGKGK